MDDEVIELEAEDIEPIGPVVEASGERGSNLGLEWPGAHLQSGQVEAAKQLAQAGDVVKAAKVFSQIGINPKPEYWRGWADVHRATLLGRMKGLSMQGRVDAVHQVVVAYVRGEAKQALAEFGLQLWDEGVPELALLVSRAVDAPDEVLEESSRN